MSLGHNRRRFIMTTAAVAAGAALHRNVSGQPMTHGKGDLIILLPGITGSVLTVNGRDAWAPSLRGISSAILTLGSSLADLRLSSSAAESDDISDGVVAQRLVNDIHLIPGLWRIDGYTRLIQAVTALPGITPKKNFFTFPYDWRKDNRVAARRLARHAHTWLSTWRAESGNANARLVLIAHSMGGLVSRYFLECLEGWKTTRKLITFGTPYRGSLNALDVLHGGVKIGPVQLANAGELLRSFTSIYQLLPTYPFLEDNGVLKRLEDFPGIGHIDYSRVVAAMKFHHEIEDANRLNRLNETYLRNGYQIHPIIGVAQKTKQIARRSGGQLNFLDQIPGMDGDGTVPRPSATPLELGGKDAEVFISENHGSLQNSNVSQTHLGGLLSGADVDWSLYRSRSGSRLSLSVPDAVVAGQEILLEGRLDPDVYRNELSVTITDLYSERQIINRLIKSDEEGAFSVSVPSLQAGAYRVTAVFTSSRRPVSSVSDVMVVLNSSVLL